MITFEDKEDIVDTEIRKRKNKWFLSQSVSHIDFDDISSIIKFHVYVKWSLWDQTKALEPWLNRVISNQIKNQIRNHYGVFAKPCINCPFQKVNVDNNGCSYTKSKVQCSECPLYAKWEKGKKHEYNIKMPSSFDVHDFELKSPTQSSLNLEKAAGVMREKMKERLNEKQFLAYNLLYVENIPEEEVAVKLGYRTSEKNRTAGYRQIKNLKNLFQDLAKKIMEEEDIFYG